VLERDVRAEEGGLGGERRARVRLRATWVDAAASRVLAEGTREAAARAEGTGAKLEHGDWSLVLGPDEPLEQALRFALREAVKEALPALAKAR
jgi:hypothetical protein